MMVRNRSKAAKPSLPAVVVHGGAGRFLYSPAREERARSALRRVADEAFERLLGGNALEVAVWAVVELENDPQFDAGTGGKLQSDGVVRLSAALMDGSRGRFSGVINIEQVKNPVLVARRLLDENFRVLAGAEALNWARQRGFGSHNPITQEQWAIWKEKAARHPPGAGSETYGTVGIVVADGRGDLAAATSTGGRGMETPGRVGDTATVAGTYASGNAAVSATGIGEELTEAAFAARIVTRVDDGLPLARAFGRTMDEMRRGGGRGGAIGVDRLGNVAASTTTECLFHAGRTPRRRFGYP